MLDVVSLLGAGWKIDDSATVTVANQMSFSNDLPDACELKNLATKVDSAWGGQPSYAPPLGWTVYWVSKAGGSSFTELTLQDTVWVSPQGVAYSVSSCAKGVTTGSDAAKVIITPKQDNTNVWLVLGALGLLAYFTFKS